METITLFPSGQKMPLVGLGLWKVTKAICAETVYSAIKAGYRLFDGACDYGNEKQAGEGIRRAIDEGIVKREDLFITSKLWNTFHAKEHVVPAVQRQLEDWGIDYFDLFIVHFPISLAYVDPNHRYPPEWFGDDGNLHLQDTPIQETWEEMETLVYHNLAKNIGVGNFAGGLILDLLRYARIKPAVLQVEMHPYLTQDALFHLARNLGIAVTAYSSFGPQGYIELNMDKGAQTLFEHDTVLKIANNHNKKPAQVLLRWATQRGIAVIPKSIDRERLVQNLGHTSFDLTQSELEQLSCLNVNLRLNNPIDIDPRLGIFA